MSAQAEQAAVEMNKERVAAARSAAPDTVRDAVIRAVAAWEGVTIHNHRFGGVEFRLGRRELGHLHATFADLPFPKVIRDELIAAGRARPHHVLPESGWVTAPMRDPAEATGIIRLFRQNYERAAGLHR